VLCVERPIVTHEALNRVDGCFSAAPPLAVQEFVGLRTGTLDAEATITTRSARLDLESHVGGRRK
jgi:hypothetical protein